MKHFYVVGMFVLLTSLLVSNVTAGNVLFVNESQPNKPVLALNDVHKIAFNGDGWNVFFNNKSQQKIDANSFDFFTFSERNQLSSISNEQSELVSAYFQGNDIIVKGISNATSFRLFDINGRLLQKGWLNNEGRARGKCTTLHSGVYILKVKADKQYTFKIMKH